MKLYMPKYALDFQCIADKCEDSCCKGWSVDLDIETYKHYQKIEDGPLKKIVAENIYLNPECVDQSVDYAKVTLTPKKRCPFLSKENLCNIQAQYGEDLLSNVCATYPRIYNRVNGKIELSMSTSCPEVMRLILQDQDSLNEVEVDVDDFPKIITYDLEKYPEIREKVFWLMTRNMPVETKLAEIGRLLADYLDLEAPVFEIYKTQALHSKMKPFVFAKTIVDQMRPYDSEAYMQSAEMSKKITDAGIERFNDFETDFQFAVTQFFLNYFRRTLFPYTEVESMFDAYRLLVVRFLIIRTQTVGAFSAGLTMNLETFGRYLQTFSKVFDHHHTFSYEVLKMLDHSNVTTVIELENLLFAKGRWA
ncbi:flagellin lysine-N-methylase [Fusibacter tunisiensis]|uniref:Lysine-N-methylase n=1 Tax=Fusibacter tunisiensis TaxID=1008308 RepID=A0ABS2MQG4_9FIRM|nr:flagellin lysine-N-methylase [Fusibacter tunisiensis]MBM7561640.1 lysine-N-methylase [Fusibacter tunisiensis]